MKNYISIIIFSSIASVAAQAEQSCGISQNQAVNSLTKMFNHRTNRNDVTEDTSLASLGAQGTGYADAYNYILQNDFQCKNFIRYQDLQQATTVGDIAVVMASK